MNKRVQVGTRRPDEIATDIRRALDDEPMWADFEDDYEALVGFLLKEAQSHGVPRELLWEYGAARWLELYPLDEESEP